MSETSDGSASVPAIPMAEPVPAGIPTPPPVSVVPLPLAYAPAAGVPYVSARKLARGVIRWTWVMVVVQVLLLWPALTALAARVNILRDEEISPGLASAVTMGDRFESFTSILLLVSLVYWLIWVHRTYRNLRPLGAEGLRFSPGWAVAYYFIPIVALFRPFQVMREAWRASDPHHGGGTAWRDGPPPRLVNGWWGLYLSSAAVGIVWLVFETNDDDPQAWVIAATINVAIVLLDLVIFMMQIAIATQLTRMQDERAGRFGTISQW